ncbi:L,D-transpeptidase [Cellulomonas alba]|uniref:L,D-transpeptidase n=1 Tax=Cellulomonas alba TaxID=3053467 RepID=A0ABT7SEV6_9CELL|nr:L,D-transpeptidase [Cellulomonas alba]MDM7854726.1 L,D-transpeptidase [Cellulomonas alba]
MPREPLTAPARVLAAAVLAVGVLAGCSPSAPVAAGPPPVVLHAAVAVAKGAPPTPVPPRVGLSGLPVIDPLHVVGGLPGLDDTAPLRAADGTWRTAVVTRDTAALETPAGRPVGVLPERTLGLATVVPVLDERDGWLRVLVATRGALPSDDRHEVNGHSVWVRAVDTRAGSTAWSIRVDTHALTLTVDDGTRVRTYPVRAVGSPQWPTPRTLAFLLGPHWVEPGTTTPRVLPLSIQSDSIDHWDRPTGTAVTAIHTTTSLRHGHVSHGCVRITDHVMDVLWDAPAGTPVTIV